MLPKSSRGPDRSIGSVRRLTVLDRTILFLMRRQRNNTGRPSVGQPRRDRALRPLLADTGQRTCPFHQVSLACALGSAFGEKREWLSGRRYGCRLQQSTSAADGIAAKVNGQHDADVQYLSLSLHDQVLRDARTASACLSKGLVLTCVLCSKSLATTANRRANSRSVSDRALAAMRASSPRDLRSR